MLKRTACLIALLVGNPLLLAGQGTETTPKLPKKESWGLVKKVKRVFVKAPVVATLSVATAIAAGSYFSSFFTEQTPPASVNNMIQITLRFEEKKYPLQLSPSLTTFENIIDYLRNKLPSECQFCEHSFLYQGKQIKGATLKKSLTTLGVKDNAVLQLIAEEEMVSLPAYFRGKNVPLSVNKRNTLGWLYDKLMKESSNKKKEKKKAERIQERPAE